MKRKLLQELNNKCPSYASTPEKQEEIYNRYKEYLTAVSIKFIFCTVLKVPAK